MVCILILMSIKKRAAQAADQSGQVTTRTRRILGHVLMVGAGFYGGFIQAGVGLILMPILHKVMGLDLVRVNLHKSFVVAVFTVVALAVYAANGQVAWLPGIWLACGNSAGAWIGTHFAVKKGDRLVRIVFDLAVIALVIKLLLSR
jgi:uncharacterized membrane protein YfcA